MAARTDRRVKRNLGDEVKQTNADICGENGEYHTFVYDGPLFDHQILLQNNGIVDLGSHMAVDIVLG